jgi:hypothetical protein
LAFAGDEVGDHIRGFVGRNVVAVAIRQISPIRAYSVGVQELMGFDEDGGGRRRAIPARFWG